MALSYLWTGMVLISLLSGALLGRLDLVSAAAAKGAQSAVETVFTLAGPLCLWCGAVSYTHLTLPTLDPV